MSAPPFYGSRWSTRSAALGRRIGTQRAISGGHKKTASGGPNSSRCTTPKKRPTTDIILAPKRIAVEIRPESAPLKEQVEVSGLRVPLLPLLHQDLGAQKPANLQMLPNATCDLKLVCKNTDFNRATSQRMLH